MNVTELGSIIEVRLQQPEKEDFPMDVTELGIVIEIRSPQPEKAKSPMDVTELGIVEFLQPITSVFEDVSITALQPSRESYFLLSLSTSN